MENNKETINICITKWKIIDYILILKHCINNVGLVGYIHYPYNIGCYIAIFDFFWNDLKQKLNITQASKKMDAFFIESFWCKTKQAQKSSRNNPIKE